MRSVLLGPRLMAKASEVKEIAKDHARYGARNVCSSSCEQGAVDAAVMHGRSLFKQNIFKVLST